MDSGREETARVMAIMQRQVSILVLMDSGREAGLGSLPASRQKCFNPCFNGFWARSLNIEKAINKLRVVSILVLMDSGREERQMTRTEEMLSRFNPCFNGFWARRAVPLSPTNTILLFQSLF